MTHLLGLTGSIGMGKSTTAKMFIDAGIPVWDADAVVHKLYAAGGAAIEPIRVFCPDVIVDGAVSRTLLSKLIAVDPMVLETVEAIVHPLVVQDRQDFIDRHVAPLLVFDIPLLFETGADEWLDSVLVVSVDPGTQKQRVLARSSMSEEKFEFIVQRQLSDEEKRAKADHVIMTYNQEDTRSDVSLLVSELLGADHA